ncbi:hypothetical protein HNY73_014432 [Argiope bruennichi]|uniref:Uncharacterized protein n=1 Tax=Argiope bruennichi TaxID=94029 RepID=A0A8T0EQ30_ARGBR|nr:hypothetical protein HNY73_014432 [Argiope bruennichi]
MSTEWHHKNNTMKPNLSNSRFGQAGGPETFGRDSRQRHSAHRDGPERILLERGVGHYGGARPSPRPTLLLLHRALPGHHLQHHPAQEDPLLHCQSHHTLRRHLRALRPRLLPALGFRGKGTVLSEILYFP